MLHPRRSSGESTAVAAAIAVVVIVAAVGGVVLYQQSNAKPVTIVSTSTVTNTATVTNASTSTVVSTVIPSNAIVPLRIFAAASFGPALQALQSSYQLNNSVSLIYNFASSGALETQIAEGAPADVYLDADMANNMKLQTANLLGDNDKYQNLIYNYIQMYVPGNNPKNISGFSDLLKPGVRIAMGAPSSVPAGAYTLQVWGNVQSKWGNASNPDFKSAIYANFTKNAMTHVVSQTTDVESAITQVLTGAADVAFGYVSDGVANAAQLHPVVIPPDVNVQAVYTASVIKASHYPAQADAFLNYLVSAQGQSFLQKWGFTPLSSGSVAGSPATASLAPTHPLERDGVAHCGGVACRAHEPIVTGARWSVGWSKNCSQHNPCAESSIVDSPKA
ncbi:MAG: molybdate ABC transporter substrate-binding protein [Thaumarchaeota archaeon]|nr:molybdate ABC transporter substrate-binding protein [Nitrososphaerota archaeon]